ncbi:MAG: FtsW/RodA/SpoVE family cell cycle protein [Flavobacteriales bacterium]|nr:FtsW/RodA/SpoVE family cell cycle protein [Flavobacteriales bacterium]
MRAVFTYLKGDKVIWMIALLLSLLSLVSVYSFTPILVRSSDTGTESFLIKHVMMVVTGFVMMFYVHNINFKYFSKLSQILVWVSVILLFVTLVAGVKINSAERWLEIPVLNIKFQTSDFAKVVLIVFVARMLTINKDKFEDFREGIVPILIPVGLVIGLIITQNLSTAVLIFGIVLIMFFLAKVPMRHILTIVGSAVAAMALMLLLAKANPELLPRLETWMNRFTSHSSEDPKKQWQINNALQAVANGGMLGQGPGNGQMKHIIPEAYADFVFASFIEEFGMLGGVALLMMYLILLYRSIRIASKCDSNFGSLLVLGLCLNLVFMAFVNMAVCTKIMPVTGQNMPLISMGGTSTWFTCVSLGMILSVSRSVEQESEEEHNRAKRNTSAKEEGGNYVVA